jgi:beta-N-acetylglucosaminidase-like protein
VNRSAIVLAWIACTASVVSAKTLRGVVEGYYGSPWSGEARRDVIRFLGAHGLNAFVYGPKNDDHHRARWREPYPDAALADLGATAREARRSHVRFVYALTPALDVCYACRDDRHALAAKLRQVASVGIRRFALFFDDAPGTLQHPEDVARYGGADASALARAQADLVNHAARFVRAHRLGGLVLIVPTDYAGTECHPYHRELAQRLRRGIGVGWTGPGVLSESVSGEEARTRAACIRHHPVVLWDNYPANDTVLSNNLHLGPLTGRSADLPAALGGYLLNPMTEAHASLVALGTAGAYLQDPRRYDPEGAWRVTLAELDARGGLAVLAENTRSSVLDLDDAHALAAAVAGLTATYDGPDWGPAVTALEAEEDRETAGASDADGPTPLATEIAPWVAELAAHAARGREAAALLRAMKPSFADDVVATSAAGLVHVSGHALGVDDAAAASTGPGFAAEAVAVAARIAAPDVGGYLACLGDLLGADIHFCPQFGLNVHGKSLFFAIESTTSVRLISDRNVHDRLVELVGSAYADFAARRAPGADTLAVTLDGASVPLDIAGRFDATIPLPPSGHARLVVTTAAGEATAVAVP